MTRGGCSWGRLLCCSAADPAVWALSTSPNNSTIYSRLPNCQPTPPCCDRYAKLAYQLVCEYLCVNAFAGLHKVFRLPLETDNWSYRLS